MSRTEPELKVRIAVTPPASVLASPDSFAAYLAACEERRVDTLWLSDVPLGPLGDPVVSLAYAAARTTRLKLGLNVVPLGRNPMWLAKQLAQVDQLSGGRLLVSMVPGLGQPAERAALGHATGDRGKAMDAVIPLLRTWWSGGAVTGSFEGFAYDAVAVEPQPVQQPLEVWLGGIGPAALDRVARLADGWLTANATPAEAGAGARTISERAAALGRVVDPEHFGISVPYAAAMPPDAVVAAVRQRRGGDGDIGQILPVGATALQDLLGAHIAQGISKFVLRPVAGSDGDSWRDELDWLAAAALPMQT